MEGIGSPPNIGVYMKKSDTEYCPYCNAPDEYFKKNVKLNIYNEIIFSNVVCENCGNIIKE
jgi:C4-type Zn-finger protein